MHAFDRQMPQSQHNEVTTDQSLLIRVRNRNVSNDSIPATRIARA